MARTLCEKQNLVFVHPFDDPEVIAGQGTLALEMIEDGPAFETMIIPIGGGGLIAGMALAIKDASPQTRILGAQAALFPSMVNALDRGDRPVGGNTLAEGIAVKEAGLLTREIVRDLVDDIILIEERPLERALSLLMNEQKLLVEGAGAMGLAAIFADPDGLKPYRGSCPMRRQYRRAVVIDDLNARPCPCRAPGAIARLASRHAGATCSRRFDHR